MPDIVKEAVFNILSARYNRHGDLPPLSVADLFAGGGSIGLEALSRGAGRCCFVERDRRALDTLRHNLDALQVGPTASVVPRDAWRHALSDAVGQPFDLVFLDPPYRDSQDTSEVGPVRRYLDRFTAENRPRPLIVLHHPAKVRFSLTPADPWRIVDRRTFGTNAITFFE